MFSNICGKNAKNVKSRWGMFSLIKETGQAKKSETLKGKTPIKLI